MEQKLTLQQIETLKSLEKIDDYPCYKMSYHGDYHFGQYLKRGANSIEDLLDFMKETQLFPPQNMEINIFGCTCFKIRNEQQQVLFGRNFDWHKRTPALLLMTEPPKGYKSMSMIDLGVLGYHGQLPEDEEGRKALLCAPYLPADGMNEKGIGVAILTLPKFSPSKDQGKVNLLCNTVLRLILDYGHSIDQIKGLLEKVNISTFYVPQRKMDLAFHLFVTDASGDSAIVEFEEGKVEVIRTDIPWQVATNFNQKLYNTRKKVEGTGFSRYRKANQILEKYAGILENNDAIELLRRCRNVTGTILFNAFGAAQTRWSMLYNLSKREGQLVIGKDYKKITTVSI